jgi:hypothetical protein
VGSEENTYQAVLQVAQELIQDVAWQGHEHGIVSDHVLERKREIMRPRNASARGYQLTFTLFPVAYHDRHQPLRLFAINMSTHDQESSRAISYDLLNAGAMVRRCRLYAHASREDVTARRDASRTDVVVVSGLEDFLAFGDLCLFLTFRG